MRAETKCAIEDRSEVSIEYSVEVPLIGNKFLPHTWLLSQEPFLSVL